MIINAYSSGGAAGGNNYATLKPTDSASGIFTFSGGDLTATKTGATTAGLYYFSRATQGKKTGKWYWETTLTGGGSGSTAYYVSAALVKASHALVSPDTSTYPGITAASVGGPFIRSDVATYFNAAGTVLNGGATVTSATLRNALDLNTGEYQQAIDGGTLTTVASGMLVGGANPEWFPAIFYRSGTSYAGSDTPAVTVNFGASAFSYSVPSGYSAGWFE